MAVGAVGLFLTAPWDGLHCVIVLFSDHTQLLFCRTYVSLLPLPVLRIVIMPSHLTRNKKTYGFTFVKAYTLSLKVTMNKSYNETFLHVTITNQGTKSFDFSRTID